MTYARVGTSGVRGGRCAREGDGARLAPSPSMRLRLREHAPAPVRPAQALAPTRAPSLGPVLSLSLSPSPSPSLFVLAAAPTLAPVLGSHVKIAFHGVGLYPSDFWAAVAPRLTTQSRCLPRQLDLFLVPGKAFGLPRLVAARKEDEVQPCRRHNRPICLPRFLLKENLVEGG